MLVVAMVCRVEKGWRWWSCEWVLGGMRDIFWQCDLEFCISSSDQGMAWEEDEGPVMIGVLDDLQQVGVGLGCMRVLGIGDLMLWL